LWFTWFVQIEPLYPYYWLYVLTGAKRVGRSGEYGHGHSSTLIHLKHLQCSGDESDIYDCVGEDDLVGCTHHNDASVECLRKFILHISVFHTSFSYQFYFLFHRLWKVKNHVCNILAVFRVQPHYIWQSGKSWELKSDSQEMAVMIAKNFYETTCVKFTWIVIINF